MPLPSKRSAHFSVVAFDFSVVINFLFYTAEKPEKWPDRGVCGPGLQRQGRIKTKRGKRFGLPAVFFDDQSATIAAIARCPRHFLTGDLLGDLSFETGAADASPVYPALGFITLVDWVLTFPFDIAGFVGPILLVGLTSGVFALVSDGFCFTLSNVVISAAGRTSAS